MLDAGATGNISETEIEFSVASRHQSSTWNIDDQTGTEPVLANTCASPPLIAKWNRKLASSKKWQPAEVAATHCSPRTGLKTTSRHLSVWPCSYEVHSYRPLFGLSLLMPGWKCMAAGSRSRRGKKWLSLLRSTAGGLKCTSPSSNLCQAQCILFEGE